MVGKGWVLAMSRAAGSVGRRSALVGVCVCVAGAVGGGWALAAPAAGTLHGCASKRTGALRLASKCRRSERAVSWNAQGRPGARGAAGPAGAIGPAGPATGAAGGALTGAFPNPGLNVTGGDSGATACADGEAVAGISKLAVLSCAPGVLTNVASNDTGAGLGALTANGGAGSSGGMTAFGYDALHAAAGGLTGLNDAFGYQALQSLASGQSDSAFGAEALGQTTNAVSDSAFGTDALGGLSTGGQGQDVAVGTSAGGNLKTGTNDTLIGQSAGVLYTGGESNDIVIGSDVDGTAGESNVIRIGQDQSKVFISGISGETTGGTAVPVLVDAAGQLGVTSSSRRFKRDIHDLGPSTLSALMRLQPVSFRYRASVAPGPWPAQFGLIAERVAKILPNLVAYGRDGKPDALAYQEFPALLLAEIQRQQHEIHALQARNRQLQHQQAEINWLMHHARLR